MSILEVQHITKKYDESSILVDVNFQLDQGQSLAITGDSGGGKTTLLSIAGLLQDATSGELLLDGKAVGKASKSEKAALRAHYYGFVFQRARLVNSLTALENILAAADFAHIVKGAKEKAAALLTSFGLSEKSGYRPQELSLGQLRRVALARALLLDPKIIFADEPTNDLDPDNAQTVVNTLFAACQTGSALLLITHDHTLAQRCDNWLNLENGQLQTIRT